MEPLKTAGSATGVALPVVSHKCLFHVGTFDPSHKGKTHNTTSLEGNGLSVSKHPDAWREIARLGDAPVWTLRQEFSAPFVDAHAMTVEHWMVVMDWARSVGFVESVELLRLSWFDEDADEQRYMLFDAKRQVKQAQDEYADYLESSDKVSLTPEVGWQGTSKMNQRIGFHVGPSSAKDLALTIYAEDVLYEGQNVHGVWWNDRLDTACLSAPRGVIHLRAINDWERSSPAESPLQTRMKKKMPKRTFTPSEERCLSVAQKEYLKAHADMVSLQPDSMLLPSEQLYKSMRHGAVTIARAMELDAHREQMAVRMPRSSTAALAYDNYDDAEDRFIERNGMSSGLS